MFEPITPETIEQKRQALENDLSPLTTDTLTIDDFSSKYGLPTVISRILKHLATSSYLSNQVLLINDVTELYVHPEKYLGQNYRQLIEFFKVLESYSIEEITAMTSKLESTQYDDKQSTLQGKNKIVESALISAIREEAETIITRKNNNSYNPETNKRYIKPFTEKVLSTALLIRGSRTAQLDSQSLGFHIPGNVGISLTGGYLSGRIKQIFK